MKKLTPTLKKNVDKLGRIMGNKQKFLTLLSISVSQEEGDVPCVRRDAAVTSLRGRARHQHGDVHPGRDTLQLSVHLPRRQVYTGDAHQGRWGSCNLDIYQDVFFTL